MNVTRRTKIVATLGPASSDAAILDALVEAGMDAARLNLSHLHPDEVAPLVVGVRRAAERKGRAVGILLDTRGPEVRLGELADAIVLKSGDPFVLWDKSPVPASSVGASVSWSGFFPRVSPGQDILIDDGRVVLCCTARHPDRIETVTKHGGLVSGRKKVSIPGLSWDLPILSPEDEVALAEGIAAGAAWVAASFVRSAEDVHTVREWVLRHGDRVGVVAKIERGEAMQALEAIVAAADGVMVARGDLGVELPSAIVPGLQKTIIRQANAGGKVVITATEMLESMIKSDRPTRAEASDVANAIWDGSDALMLSAETAVGDHPVAVVRAMAEIAADADSLRQYRQPTGWTPHGVGPAVAQAAFSVAESLNAAAIVTPTKSGQTSRMVSKCRPTAPIVAFSPEAAVLQHLALVWGVLPLPMEWTGNPARLLARALSQTREALGADRDAVYVVTMGVPAGAETNVLRVERMFEPSVAPK